LTLDPGDKLRLLVMLDGKTVAGAAVSYDGRLRGITDENGRINIRIRRAGLQMIQATLSLPYPGPEADETVHTTMLNFEVQPR
jgi:nickel transport protein